LIQKLRGGSYRPVFQSQGEIMWSKKLRELSKTALEYDGVHVKSSNGNFGILNIDYENKIYTISIKPDFNINLTFHSVQEIIKAGWAVD
jgi:hypothetical protein